MENRSSLEITTVIGCKNMCSYCPQAKLITNYKSGEKILSFENYKKCLGKVPKNVGIHFSGFAEAWQNPEATRMLLYADNKGYKTSVYTTLVGMHVRDVENLKSIRFEKFVVHLPNTKKSERIRADKGYLRLLKKIVDSKISGARFVVYGDAKKPIKGIIEKGGYKLRHFELISRCGSVCGVKAKHKKGALVCSHGRLGSGVMLPNGDVYLCCMDYGLRHNLGNLLKGDYAGLHGNAAFAEIKKGMDAPDSEILCRDCDWAEKKNTPNAVKLLKKKKRNLIKIIKYDVLKKF